MLISRGAEGRTQIDDTWRCWGEDSGGSDRETRQWDFMAPHVIPVMREKEDGSLGKKLQELKPPGEAFKDMDIYQMGGSHKKCCRVL